MSLIGDLSCDKTKITCDQKGKRTSLAELQKDCHGPLELALPEVEKNTCLALKKLLQMVS